MDVVGGTAWASGCFKRAQMSGANVLELRGRGECTILQMY